MTEEEIALIERSKHEAYQAAQRAGGPLARTLFERAELAALRRMMIEGAPELANAPRSYVIVHRWLHYWALVLEEIAT